MPHSYQCNDAGREVAPRQYTRAELGLPENGFVFCCFNNNVKIAPESFAGWMRILLRVAGSVLWLLEDNPTAADNLRRHATALGVDPARLIFASRVPVTLHLARHRVADLFLDTAPYNAHTTASDALWAGVPVLTRPGATFAGRVAASLLQALRLPELITSSQQHYEALAIELATEPARLAAIARQLAVQRVEAPLFDTTLFARHLERAFTAIVTRHRRGMAPVDLRVTDLVAGP